MQKQDEIITFQTYYNQMEAEIIRTKLEANGVNCFIADESLGVLYPVYNQGGGGVKIKIFAQDMERCKEILADEANLSPDEDINTEQ